MTARKKGRRRHVPQRTCVGCRQVLPKRSMTRIVRTPEGVRVDPTGKTPGRGAYLHNQRSCWEVGLHGALAKALRTELTMADREYLTGHMAALPADRDM
ncbi:MAG TPA: YlxR family protein [Anaerolineae bacterium]|nr:YlxR family protein [Anaerolineae bacterium]